MSGSNPHFPAILVKFSCNLLHSSFFKILAFLTFFINLTFFQNAQFCHFDQYHHITCTNCPSRMGLFKGFGAKRGGRAHPAPPPLDPRLMYYE